MVIVRILLIALLFATSFSTQVEQDLDITKATHWEDTQDLRIVERSIKFRPERDLGNDVRRCAEVIVDMTFLNQSERPIRRVDFEIVIYGKKTHNLPNEKRASISKQFSYHHLLPPGTTGSLLNEMGDCKLVAPVRQTVRVVRIVYED